MGGARSGFLIRANYDPEVLTTPFFSFVALPIHGDHFCKNPRAVNLTPSNEFENTQFIQLLMRILREQNKIDCIILGQGSAGLRTTRVRLGAA